MATTLTTLRDRVEQVLQDTGNTKWGTDDLDEAIRQALAAYSEHIPHRTIITITLTEATREIDISAIAYRNVERVWWDYDDLSPDHPPNWRNFEVWPGDVLFINDPEEPAAGDVVRLWYTDDHTLNGLDSATVTTFPVRHDSLIVQGAAGFAAAARRVTILEQTNVNEWAPRNLREWAELQLSVFYTQLSELATRQAVLASGSAGIPDLDRWDGQNTW